MGDTAYFEKVVSASNAPIGTLTGQWGAWRSNLGMIQLLGNHISKAENLILMSEGDQVIHPHTTVPNDIRPSEWLNPRLLPDLQSEQLALVAQYREAHAGEVVEEEGQLAAQCNSHGEMCRSLADSFKAQRESMNQSLPRNAAPMRTTPPQSASLASLCRSMQHGDGLVDNAMRDQVRQQQQAYLQQQHNQMAAARVPAQASSQGQTPQAPTSTPASLSTATSSTPQTIQQQQQHAQQMQQQKQMATMRQGGLNLAGMQPGAVQTLSMGGPPGAKPTTAPVMNSSGQPVVVGRAGSAGAGMIAKATHSMPGQQNLSSTPQIAPQPRTMTRATTSYAQQAVPSSTPSSEYAPTRNVQFGPVPTPGPGMRSTGGYAQVQAMQQQQQQQQQQNQPGAHMQQAPSGFAPHGAPMYGSAPHNPQAKR